MAQELDPGLEVQRIQAMLTRERLAVDLCDGSRTAFLTHVGAAPRLASGAWIAHRQLIMALALANLSPQVRASLARSVLVEWSREFGVGRLRLMALASGLPLGGSSLLMRGHSGPRVLYTWALGPRASVHECDWLLLRAQPGWACDAPPRAIGVRGLETLTQLGGGVLVLVPSAVAARQIANVAGRSLALGSHARFTPFLEESDGDATLLLWPQDALGAASLERREISTIVLVAAPEDVRQRAVRWAGARPGVEVVDAACPGRMSREGLSHYWRACGKPKILLRGDPQWASEGRAWLESLGATVTREAEATQLGLF